MRACIAMRPSCSPRPGSALTRAPERRDERLKLARGGAKSTASVVPHRARFCGVLPSAQRTSPSSSPRAVGPVAPLVPHAPARLHVDWLGGGTAVVPSQEQDAQLLPVGVPVATLPLPPQPHRTAAHRLSVVFGSPEQSARRPGHRRHSPPPGVTHVSVVSSPGFPPALTDHLPVAPMYPRARTCHSQSVTHHLDRKRNGPVFAHGPAVIARRFR